MPEVYDVPLIVRFPGGEHAGTSSDMFVQHHDIADAILEVTGVEPPSEIDGVSFLDDALAGNEGPRDHATVGWGSAATVITERWWLNYKVDETGFLLYDLTVEDPFANNVASEHPDVVRELMAMAKEDAGGAFPEWVIELAENQADAPGCSDLAARE